MACLAPKDIAGESYCGYKTNGDLEGEKKGCNAVVSVVSHFSQLGVCSWRAALPGAAEFCNATSPDTCTRKSAHWAYSCPLALTSSP